MLWDSYIQNLARKLTNIVGVLYKHYHMLPSSVKLLIYNAVFNSHISYCHLVWATTTSTYLNKLFSLQKKAIRVVANASYYTHTDPLFYNHELIKIPEYYTYKLVTVYVASLKCFNHPLLRLSRLSVKNMVYGVCSVGASEATNRLAMLTAAHFLTCTRIH